MASNYYVNIDFTNLDSRDLNMYYCGHRQNSPGHSYGPAMRDHYLLVYVVNGCGKYQINGRIYHIEAKSVFVVFPHCKVFYQADQQNPWENIWLGLYGNLLDKYMSYLNLHPANPVYSLAQPGKLECLLHELVLTVQENTLESQMNSIGYLYRVFSELLYDYRHHRVEIPTHPQKDKYFDKAITFIKFNYNRDINCQDIAKHVGLERSYFSKLFKDHIKLSPSDYLTNCRMEKASQLLLETDLSVETIGYSVGIRDPFYFSRLFKAHFGISPQGYRKR